MKKKGMVNDLKKKYVLLAMVCCLSLMVFVGCGNKDNDDTNNGVTASPAIDDVTASPGATDDNVLDDMVDGVDDVIDGTEDAVDDAVNGAEDAIDDATGNDTNNTNTDTNRNDTTNDNTKNKNDTDTNNTTNNTNKNTTKK